MILNSGYNEADMKKFLNNVSDQTANALTKVYPGWSFLWTIGNIFTHFLNCLQFAVCDDVVEADRIIVSSTELGSWTGASGSYTEKRVYPGTILLTDVDQIQCTQ